MKLAHTLAKTLPILFILSGCHLLPTISDCSSKESFGMIQNPTNIDKSLQQKPLVITCESPYEQQAIKDALTLAQERCNTQFDILNSDTNKIPHTIKMQHGDGWVDIGADRYRSIMTIHCQQVN